MTVQEVYDSALADAGVNAATIKPAEGADAYAVDIVNRASGEILSYYRTRLSDEALFRKSFTHDFLAQEGRADDSADVLSLDTNEQIVALFVKYSESGEFRRAFHDTQRTGSSPITELRKYASPDAPCFVMQELEIFIAPLPQETVPGGIYVLTEEPILTLTKTSDSINSVLDAQPDVIITRVLATLYRRLQKLSEAKAAYETYLGLRQDGAASLAGRVSTTHVKTEIPNYY